MRAGSDGRKRKNHEERASCVEKSRCCWAPARWPRAPSCLEMRGRFTAAGWAQGRHDHAPSAFIHIRAAAVAESSTASSSLCCGPARRGPRLGQAMDAAPRRPSGRFSAALRWPLPSDCCILKKASTQPVHQPARSDPW